MSSDQRIYHITAASAWQTAQEKGQYEHPSLHSEGFIHCSYRDQLAETARVHYREQSNLVLLCLNPALLKSELKVETSRSGAQFPHLYGSLNLDAVELALPFAPPSLESVLASWASVL
jgi:uncharacterized protein (DUF952 family)